MKVTIALRPDGVSAVAKGDELYSWHFVTYNLDNEYDKVGKGCVVIAENVPVELPLREDCVHTALRILSEKETEARQELNERLADLEEQRSKLLAITNGVQA